MGVQLPAAFETVQFISTNHEAGSQLSSGVLHSLTVRATHKEHTFILELHLGLKPRCTCTIMQAPETKSNTSEY